MPTLAVSRTIVNTRDSRLTSSPLEAGITIANAVGAVAVIVAVAETQDFIIAVIAVESRITSTLSVSLLPMATAVDGRNSRRMSCLKV